MAGTDGLDGRLHIFQELARRQHVRSAVFIAADLRARAIAALRELWP